MRPTFSVLRITLCVNNFHTRHHARQKLFLLNALDNRDDTKDRDFYGTCRLKSDICAVFFSSSLMQALVFVGYNDSKRFTD